MEHADKKITFEEFLGLKDDRAMELVGGEVVLMSPASPVHSQAQTNILTTAKQANDGGKTPAGKDGLIILCEAWTYYDNHNSFVHDVAAFERSKVKTLPETGPIKATPFWVAEVLSPSNWIVDTERKRLILEENGVPYYWIVNPIEKNLMVFHQKCPKEHYQLIQSASIESKTITLEPFGSIDVSTLFRA